MTKTASEQAADFLLNPNTAAEPEKVSPADELAALISRDEDWTDADVERARTLRVQMREERVASRRHKREGIAGDFDADGSAAPKSAPESASEVQGARLLKGLGY